MTPEERAEKIVLECPDGPQAAPFIAAQIHEAVEEAKVFEAIATRAGILSAMKVAYEDAAKIADDYAKDREKRIESEVNPVFIRTCERMAEIAYDIESTIRSRAKDLA